uniref:Uncharacterized protein n=1 Tax=Timema cristinae TaxID=61476 RepID=A0A7R9DPT7_TIMCR|nr:unnamed protein product [Timema cristinae]
MSIHLKHGHHVFVNARMRPPGEQIVYKVPCGVHTLDVWEEKRIMAAGGIDRAVRLWTISTKGNPFMTLYGHTYPIHKVLFIPHLNVLISITTKLNIRVECVSPKEGVGYVRRG